MMNQPRSAETHGALTAADAARAALNAEAGEGAVAVVLVVGSTPDEARVELDRSAGRRLLLSEAGRVHGTLGDAEVDSEALRLARAALRDAANGAVAATHAVQLDDRRYTLYVEVHHAPDELLIVGAGHIAIPLARLGAMIGFRVTVLDDREQFATTDRFPRAAAVIRADFTDPFRHVTIGARTHIVLVTRAHRYDFDCLRRLLEQDTRPAYIGLIGSRRRIRAAFHALLGAGCPRERLARVHAPVGLDIAAETPEEIAVSIAAELIQVRRSPENAARGAAEPGSAGRPSRANEASLTERERVLDRFFPPTASGAPDQPG